MEGLCDDKFNKNNDKFLKIIFDKFNNFISNFF